MIFDDHDVNDDWNTSEAWVQRIRSEPWWDERIAGGFMSYWIYQHLGNLSPHELAGKEILERVKEVDDAGPLLRDFAHKADRDVIHRYAGASAGTSATPGSSSSTRGQAEF